MEKELLYKYIKGLTSEREERTVTEWLEADPENQKELNALWFVQNAAIAHAPGPERKPVSSPLRWFARPLVRRLMQAAAVLTLIVGSWQLSRTVTIGDASRQYLTIMAPAGQRVDITLQDGSTVCLNSGARLEYPVRFGKTRRVKLSGEAMFDVDRDAAHPFVVETFACDVEVLGTKFNVTADEAAHLFSTALLRGKLRVTNRLAGDDRIVMQTNDLVTLNGDRLVLQSIENSDDYLWPEGILNLVGHDFRQIVARLEKLYGVQIRIETKTTPPLNVIRGKIPVAMGLDYALRALQQVAPFEYVQEDNHTITIR